MKKFRKPILAVIAGTGLFIVSLYPELQDIGLKISAVAVAVYGLLRSPNNDE